MSVLLLTPEHKQTESLAGYMLRVSETNGYDTPLHILNLAQITGKEMRGYVFPIQKIASVLGRDLEELEPIAYRSMSMGNGFQILGQCLWKARGDRPLRLKTPAICPNCVKENEYIDAFWDLSFAVACPDHGTLPLEKCPECDAPLSFYRPGLLKCKCGASLANASSGPAAPAVVELMRILCAKVHDDPVQPQLDGRLPERLWHLSLHSLVILISALRDFAVGGASTKHLITSHQAIAVAVEAIQDWPIGFQSLLKKIDDQQQSINGGLKSLIKRFNRFYLSLFKQRQVTTDFSLFKDEFIRFALMKKCNGDNAIEMTKIIPPIEQPFATSRELADLIGVTQRMLMAWDRAGKISLKVASPENYRSDVTDATSIPIPSGSGSKYLPERKAARLIGLPVSVLNSLRESGHYATEYMPKNMWGYHASDLEVFQQTLLHKSCLITRTAAPENTVTLNYVMQEIRFWSKEGKAKFLACYLAGEIQSVGRLNDCIQSILFRSQDVQALARQGRAEASEGTMSQQDASDLIGCDLQTIPGLIKNAYLDCLPGPDRFRITPESVRTFAAKYLALGDLARELNTTVVRLRKISNSSSIEVIAIEKSRSGRSYFVPRSMREMLISKFWKSRVEHIENRLSPEKSIQRYFKQLKEHNICLPRKGAVPNRAAISRACRFDRSAFIKNERVIRILQEFEREDAARFKLQPKLAPVDALKRYLERLATSNSPIPLCGQRPNKRAIARSCGFKRDYFYSSKELDVLLEAYSNRQESGSDMRIASISFQPENRSVQNVPTI